MLTLSTCLHRRTSSPSSGTLRPISGRSKRRRRLPVRRVRHTRRTRWSKPSRSPTEPLGAQPQHGGAPARLLLLLLTMGHLYAEHAVVCRNSACSPCRDFLPVTAITITQNPFMAVTWSSSRSDTSHVYVRRHSVVVSSLVHDPAQLSLLTYLLTPSYDVRRFRAGHCVKGVANIGDHAPSRLRTRHRWRLTCAMEPPCQLGPG